MISETARILFTVIPSQFFHCHHIRSYGRHRRLNYYFRLAYSNSIANITYKYYINAIYVCSFYRLDV